MKELFKRLLGPGAIDAIRHARLRVGFCRQFGWRYLRMSRFKTVQGFMLDEEAVALFGVAAQVAQPAPVAVEIGSWLGKSTVVIGAALAEKPGAKLVCVDPFDGSGDVRSESRYKSDAEALGRPLRTAFDQNVAAAGLSGLVQVLQGKSAEVGGSWNDPIDFLFIDGDHSYPSVVIDFDTWAHRLRPGGYLLFHDTWFEKPSAEMTEYHTGPAQVVRERVIDKPEWEVLQQHHSLFVARRRSSAQAN